MLEIKPSEPEPEGRGFDTSPAASDGSGSPSSYPTPIAPIPAGDHESFVGRRLHRLPRRRFREGNPSARRASIERRGPCRTKRARRARCTPRGASPRRGSSLAARVGIERPTFGFGDKFRVTNARTSASNRSHSSARCSQRASDALEFSLEYALAPTYPSSVSAVSVAGMKCPSTTSRAIRAIATAKPVASL